MQLPKEIKKLIETYNSNPKKRMHRELQSLNHRHIRRRYYMEWRVFIDLPNRMLWPGYKEKLHLTTWRRKFDWNSNMVFLIKKPF